MNIIERSVRQPIAVLVAVLLVVIFGSLGVLGIFDFLKLPVQLTPNVDQPVITIETHWAGASPQEIEQEIIREQEEVLKTVSDLREMTSSCQESVGQIELKFYVGVNKDAALNEVRDKLRQVPEYPPQVDEPIVESVDSGADQPIAWMMIRPAPGQDPTARTAEEVGIDGYSGDVTQLQDFLEDEAKPLLERVPGVAGVQVLGGREREMQVRVDLQKLASRGITISQLIDVLRRENQNVSAGAIGEGKRDVSVRATGQYEDDPQAILNTVIAYEAKGSPIYVRDVADAQIGFKRQAVFARSSGQNVVVMNARRETGSNVLTVMAGLKEAIARVNQDVLGPRKLGLELYQVYDESEYVSRSLENARGDLIMGGILAATVLFLALRSVGATLVVSITIPISIAGTFLGMALAGRNLNVISMAGLAFSIGIGIDNAIVVLENIFRHREMGKNRRQAALDGTREVWGAIVAATLTNVAVFVPILFIEEEAGQLFRDIAVAITIAMFLYLALSPTLIPMLASQFLRKMPGGFTVEGESERPQTRFGRFTAPIGHAGAAMSHAFYGVVLWFTGGLRRRVVMVLVLVGVPSLVAWLLVPPRTYLPPGNQNFIFSFLAPPPGYSIDEFRKMASVVESRVRPWWEVKQGSAEHRALQEQWRQANLQQAQMLEEQLKQMKQAVDGGFMPAAAYQGASQYLGAKIAALRNAPPPPAIEHYFFVAFFGQAFMGCSSQDPDVVAPLVNVMNQAVEGIPGTMGIATQAEIFRTGRSAGSSLDVIVSGTDYDKVRQVAAILQGKLMERFQTFIRPEPLNFHLGRSETRVEPDRVQAALAGVPAGTIRDLAQAGVDGVVIGDYRTRGQTIDLSVIASEARQSGVAALRDLPTASMDGRIVPLSSVARFIETTAPQQITRYNRLPAVSLIVPVPSGQTLQETEAILQNEVLAPMRSEGMIPPGVSVGLTGSADKLAEFMKTFIPGFVLAGIVTYLLLAALYESFLYPVIIILTVPMALVGGIWGLALLHAFEPTALLDVLTMLGFVILIGVVINNPILIVHQTLNYLQQGMDRQHAIAMATQSRVRPIFMSVITSVAGMAPLVVFGGAGSELYRGLGAVVVGGLLISTVFTLFLTPTLMSLAMDGQDWVHRKLSGRRRSEPETVTIPEATIADGNGRK